MNNVGFNCTEWFFFDNNKKWLKRTQEEDIVICNLNNALDNQEINKQEPRDDNLLRWISIPRKITLAFY